MLNRIVIMGRLVRDPELRTTQTGISVTSFTMAVDRDFKNKDTNEKNTDFIDVVAWRQTAEFVCKYMTKGRMAVVEGRLQIRDWKDRDGNNRRSAEVVADNVYFGDSKRDSGGDNYGSPPPYGTPAAAPYGGGQSAYGGESQGAFGGGYGAPTADGPGFEAIIANQEDGDVPF